MRRIGVNALPRVGASSCCSDPDEKIVGREARAPRPKKCRHTRSGQAPRIFRAPPVVAAINISHGESNGGANPLRACLIGPNLISRKWLWEPNRISHRTEKSHHLEFNCDRMTRSWLPHAANRKWISALRKLGHPRGQLGQIVSIDVWIGPLLGFHAVEGPSGDSQQFGGTGAVSASELQHLADIPLDHLGQRGEAPRLTRW